MQLEGTWSVNKQLPKLEMFKLMFPGRKEWKKENLKKERKRDIEEVSKKTYNYDYY